MKKYLLSIILTKMILSEMIFACCSLPLFDLRSDENIFDSPEYLSYEQKEDGETCATSCILVALAELGSEIPITRKTEDFVHNKISMKNHDFSDRGALFADIVSFLNQYKEQGKKIAKANFYLNLDQKRAKSIIQKCHGEMKTIAKTLWENHKKSPKLTVDEFLELLKEGTSFIVPLMMPSVQGYHYILIRKNKDDDSIILMDSGYGENFKIECDDFLDFFFDGKKCKIGKHPCLFFEAIISVEKFL